MLAADIFKASILIVDDQEANVMLLEQMLANAGYVNVSSTSDATTVCAMHAAQPFDLILLDLQMPVMDGFAVMEGLKLQNPQDYLPVLVITAQPDQKLRALRAGAKDFVSKPFDLLEVQTRIHNMLEVRLLYRKLDAHNVVLEQMVQERTAELRESEARFKSFTQLSSDWYWEQDAQGVFTQYAGPVFEMLGMETGDEAARKGWDPVEQAALNAKIANRESFIDFIYTRTGADGVKEILQVSGEPMFDAGSRFIGYRGVGANVSARMRHN